jgi:hypothetical protein
MELRLDTWKVFIHGAISNHRWLDVGVGCFTFHVPCHIKPQHILPIFNGPGKWQGRQDTGKAIKTERER